MTPWLALVSLDWFLAVFPACVVPEGFVAGQLLCAGCGLREQEIPNLNFWIAFPFNPLQTYVNSSLSLLVLGPEAGRPFFSNLEPLQILTEI